MNALKQPVLPFRLLTAAVFIALLLPALFMDGMFMDGQIYATVSQNLAEGRGTFWDPTFSSAYMTSYHEQPPLLFGMESLLFRALGDSLYTERIFCLLLALLAAAGISRVWKQLHSGELRQMNWWPVLLWIIMPVVFWAYVNHVEEAAMAVFVLFAVEMQLRAFRSSRFWFLIVSGLLLVGASMCKGVQGLFPLVFPVLYALFTKERSISKAIIDSIIIGVTIAAVYALMALDPAMRLSYAKYYHDRIYATFNVAEAATTNNRLYLLWELLQNMFVPLGIVAVLYFLLRRKVGNLRRAAAFFALALCGIVPLLVTREQRGFYLVTALPFVALALALLPAPALQERIAKIRRTKIISAVMVLCIAGGITAAVVSAGQPKRDKDILHDVYLFGKTIGRDEVVTVPPDVFASWSFHAYLVRHYNIALDKNEGHAYFISEKTDTVIPAGYQPVKLETKRFRLLRKTE